MGFRPPILQVPGGALCRWPVGSDKGTVTQRERLLACLLCVRVALQRERERTVNEFFVGREGWGDFVFVFFFFGSSVS